MTGKYYGTKLYPSGQKRMDELMDMTGFQPSAILRGSVMTVHKLLASGQLTVTELSLNSREGMRREFEE